MSLAGTGVSLKSRYEDAMREYRTAFTRYVDRKQKETGGREDSASRSTAGRDSTSARRESGDAGCRRPAVVRPPVTRFGETASGAVIDAGLLAVFSLVAFAGSFLAFLRYDVR